MVASIWIQCSAGTSYTLQGYSQSTLDTISVSIFKDIGANAGVFSGLLLSAAPSRPRVVFAAGSAKCFAGYFMTWASMVGLVREQPVWAVCGYMLLAAPLFNVTKFLGF